MKSRTYLIGGVLLLLLAAGVYAIRKPDARSIITTAESKKSVAAITAADKQGVIESTKDSRIDDRKRDNDRKRSELRNPYLIVKYGESRVNLSRHITNESMAIANDFMELGGLSGIKKSMSAGEGAETNPMSDVTDKLGTISDKLNLTADQLSKTAILLAEGNQREMAMCKEAFRQLSKDPTAMMTALLVDDAAARREIDENEFTRLKSELKASMTFQPDDLKNALSDKGNPLEDDIFVQSFKALLTSDQQLVVDNEIKSNISAGKVDDSKAEDALFKNQKNLEEVDTSIAAGRKMMTGLKNMIEGIAGISKSNTK